MVTREEIQTELMRTSVKDPSSRLWELYWFLKKELYADEKFSEYYPKILNVLQEELW